jgi:hypothetical protein
MSSYMQVEPEEALVRLEEHLTTTVLFRTYIQDIDDK